MSVDLDHLTRILNTATEKLKEASDIAHKDPRKAMQCIPAVLVHFSELQSMHHLNEISISNVDAAQKKSVISAIHQFLVNTKETQEKVGTMGAALFGTSQFQELKSNLELVKKSLEKGKKVDRIEEGHGI